jgi:hypothetical protein
MGLALGEPPGVAGSDASGSHVGGGGPPSLASAAFRLFSNASLSASLIEVRIVSASAPWMIPPNGTCSSSSSWTSCTRFPPPLGTRRRTTIPLFSFGCLFLDADGSGVTAATGLSSRTLGVPLRTLGVSIASSEARDLTGLILRIVGVWMNGISGAIGDSEGTARAASGFGLGTLLWRHTGHTQ